MTKQHKEIKLVFDDGTEETVKQGCAVVMAQNQEELNVTLYFPDGTGHTEMGELIYVLKTLFGDKENLEI